MNKKKFLTFIDKMTTPKNATLMEAVKKGFKVCCEASETKRWWYGIPGIELIWHGEWSDPELRRGDEIVNMHDVEDALWESFRDETGTEDDDKFGEWLRDNEDLVNEYFDYAVEYGK